MMPSAATRITTRNNGYGLQLYEDWMDYKRAPHSQRSDSIISRGELAKSQARSRFQLHDAYAESLTSNRNEPGSDGTKKVKAVDSEHPIGDIVPFNIENTADKASNNERRNSKISNKKKAKRAQLADPKVQKAFSAAENQKLIKSIVDDFCPFYEWITNGREDDINEKVITGLLFKKK